MNIIEILLLSIALSCDAMICSVIYGQRRSSADVRRRNALLFAAFFGAFQFLMPVIGFFGGQALLRLIQNYDHWVAFALLLAVSISMIRECFTHDEEKKDLFKEKIPVLTVLVLAVATSIDALAVGMSIGMLETRIFYVSTVIGAVCFCLSCMCFYAATPLSRIKSLDKVMNVLGAMVLTGIGIRVLIEHGVF